MEPNQIYKLLYSKGNQEQNEMKTHRMGENILEIKPLWVVPFANIFSDYVDCLFILFVVSFAV